MLLNCPDASIMQFIHVTYVTIRLGTHYSAVKTARERECVILDTRGSQAVLVLIHMLDTRRSASRK